MTMTEPTKVAEPNRPVIDLAAIVKVEDIFGRPLLAEVAAVTREVEEMKVEIRLLLERAANVVAAVYALEKRVYPVHGEIPGLEGDLRVHDGLGEVLQAAAGLAHLSKVASDAGLHHAIFEPEFEPEPFMLQ